MKITSLFVTLVCLFFSTQISAQYEQDTLETIEKTPSSFTPPTVGLGVGLISFYGDLRDYKYGNPFVSNPVYELYVHQPILDYLSLNVYFMFGKLRVEERRVERNLNFESTIRASGLNFEYNFGNFLNPDRNFSPFITAGVEIFEFNSKTDILDKNGNPYYYWSDGTIRNIAQDDPSAEFAVEVSRDYTYETDIREARFGGKELYPERGVAIPLGIGFGLKITNQINFRLASTMHLTFTDNIDGIDVHSPPERLANDRANANNDYFLASTVSLTYNFRKVDSYKDGFDKDEVIDFYAYDNNDYDDDGIIDFYDKCPNTPIGVEVDTLGCPIDSDGDGLADYLDKEINSPGTTVNAEGVYLTDEMIYESYLRYSDTSGEFADVVSTNFSGKSKTQSRFRINVGEYARGQEPAGIEQLLNLPDLKTEVKDSTVLYSVGSSNNLEDVVKRKTEISQLGLNPTIEERKNDNSYSDAGQRVNELKPLNNSGSGIDPNQVIFRVQLGAFKSKPDDSYFKNVDNIIVQENDNIYRYYSGAFDTFEAAAAHKVKLSVAGFKGAFVAAFKGGKKVPLKSVGVNPIQQSPLIGN